MTRRVGVYLRISKDRDGSGLAVERQREDALRLVEARRWELVDEYVDNDISARGRKRRPEFERLLVDVEQGRIDTVVSERWDRLSRNRRDELNLIEVAQHHQALIALIKGSDIDMTTAAGRLFADMLGGFARHEIEVKSERHQRQIAQAAAQGRMVGGRRAFGYSASGLELDPVESAILRQLYDRFLTGESLASLARWLNEHGLKTPQGRRFRHPTVREILANPRNAALRGMRDVVDHKSGTRAQWHRIIGPAVWPAVVSEETWRATLDRMKDPGRPGAHAGTSAQRYLLTGIALCGVEVEPGQLCERPLITGGARDERRLRCPTLRHVARRADYIEAYIEEVLLEWFRRDDTPTLAAERPVPDDLDLDAVRSESIELRSRLEGLARDYADGVLDRAQVKSAGDRMRARLAELDELVARAGQVDVLAPLRAAEDPATVWDEEYTMPTRREVVRRVMTVHVLNGKPGRPGGLRFQPETVRISWRQ